MSPAQLRKQKLCPPWEIGKLTADAWRPENPRQAQMKVTFRKHENQRETREEKQEEAQRKEKHIHRQDTEQ